MNYGLIRLAKTSFLAFGMLFLGIQMVAPVQYWGDCSTSGTTGNNNQKKETIAVEIIRDSGLLVTTVGNEENFLPPVNLERNSFYAQDDSGSGFLAKVSEALQASLLTDTSGATDMGVDTKQEKTSQDIEVLTAGETCRNQTIKPFWVGILVSGTLGIVFGLSYLGYIREEEKKAGVKIQRKGFFKSFFK